MEGTGPITWSMRTDQGRVRDHNEDYILYNEPSSPDDADQNGWIFLVADGVGGSEAGEVASKHAAQQTIRHYLENRNEPEVEERLLEAINSANDDLKRLIEERATGKRMATTLVACVIQQGRATIANVGDSRAYLWQDNVLRQVTKDQSLVAKLVEEGVITAEEANSHPRKNVILHSLGSEESPQIDLYQLELNPGEQLIMCSDGLTRHLQDSEIESIVATYSPTDAAEKMVRLANDRGGEDNISVAVIKIGEGLSPEGVHEPHGAKVNPEADAELSISPVMGEFRFQPLTLTIVFLILVILIRFITGR